MSKRALAKQKTKKHRKDHSAPDPTKAYDRSGTNQVSYLQSLSMKGGGRGDGGVDINGNKFYERGGKEESLMKGGGKGKGKGRGGNSDGLNPDTGKPITYNPGGTNPSPKDSYGGAFTGAMDYLKNLTGGSVSPVGNGGIHPPKSGAGDTSMADMFKNAENHPNVQINTLPNFLDDTRRGSGDGPLPPGAIPKGQTQPQGQGQGKTYEPFTIENYVPMRTSVADKQQMYINEYKGKGFYGAPQFKATNPFTGEPYKMGANGLPDYSQMNYAPGTYIPGQLKPKK